MVMHVGLQNWSSFSFYVQVHNVHASQDIYRFLEVMIYLLNDIIVFNNWILTKDMVKSLNNVHGTPLYLKLQI